MFWSIRSIYFVAKYSLASCESFQQSMWPIQVAIDHRSVASIARAHHTALPSKIEQKYKNIDGKCSKCAIEMTHRKRCYLRSLPLYDVHWKFNASNTKLFVVSDDKLNFCTNATDLGALSLATNTNWVNVISVIGQSPTQNGTVKVNFVWWSVFEQLAVPVYSGRVITDHVCSQRKIHSALYWESNCWSKRSFAVQYDFSQSPQSHFEMRKITEVNLMNFYFCSVLLVWTIELIY